MRACVYLSAINVSSNLGHLAHSLGLGLASIDARRHDFEAVQDRFDALVVAMCRGSVLEHLLRHTSK